MKYVIFKKVLIIGIIFLFVTTGFSSVIIAQNNIKISQSSPTNQTKKILVNKIKDIIKKVDLPKHRLLLFFVGAVFYSRLIRAVILFFISTAPGPRDTIVSTHPLLTCRSLWLLMTSEFWLNKWIQISDKNGWDWDNVFFP
jgi:hypothetical protein